MTPAPMSLRNMRENGVRSLAVTCGALPCRVLRGGSGCRCCGFPVVGEKNEPLCLMGASVAELVQLGAIEQFSCRKRAELATG